MVKGWVLPRTLAKLVSLSMTIKWADFQPGKIVIMPQLLLVDNVFKLLQLFFLPFELLQECRLFLDLLR